ncbi:hypothetical protein FTM57_01145 [Chlamydia trachomatis]|jgi:hypothetical protein|uniref:Uncharacterized protein n=2 Tax=Chlamydia muridarum TaxID=83560 RepID=A0A069ZSQ9_CHLMR|nr:hypothetical protein [Chlamydia muridarum]UFV53772.1 hypothetical protein FTN18_01125 [Chlamydia trachomatis]AAF39072.1 hypothetical protein TC_0199 [Chlamydia muridarum str. Nigg]AHH22591.1 hypothetical protein TAC_01050 [Chlamydia muridarum str. Nigg3 CMUT3-5]AHH23515.1 hypothetical protein Y015_01050 [Chlamydia muridarum str. Nigg CM972]AID37736.1 hypothetical protein BB17_01070 [Chlamydia muridarum str. Nigg 2 MCR]
MTILSNDGTSEFVTSFINEVEMAKAAQFSRKDSIVKSFCVAGLISIIAGVAGLLTMGIVGCSMAAGWGLLGAIVASVVVAVGLCCLSVAVCLLVKKSNLWSKEHQLWMEMKSKFQSLLAEATTAAKALQEEVNNISIGWKNDTEIYKEDVSGYENVLEEQSLQLTQMRDQCGALQKENSSLRKKVFLHDMKALRESVKAGKQRLGIKKGRRASIS